MQLSIRIADPAGNITIFVMNEVPCEKYAQIAAKLLSIKEYHAEQVAFQTVPKLGANGRIQMMGGEFCGNAARSYGYLISTLLPEKPDVVQIEISGAEHPLTVTVDQQQGSCKTEMPLPICTTSVSFNGSKYNAVCFEGIVHLIIQGARRSQEFVEELFAAAKKQIPSSAYGIMFLKETQMIPVVYVCDTDSIVWESSCGSGSMAVAVFMALSQKDGEYCYSLQQPGGVIEASASVKNGKAVRCSMGGPVSLSEEIILELHNV